MSEELKEKIKEIQGHCHHKWNEKCWYEDTLVKIREEEQAWDEDYVDRRLSDEQDKALLELFESYLQEVIGEDEITEESGYGVSGTSPRTKGEERALIRTLLKQEQRSRLESQKKA